MKRYQEFYFADEKPLAMTADSFATLVRRLRLAEPYMTQREFAEYAGIDMVYLSKIEAGKIDPSCTDEKDRIMAALDTKGRRKA